MRPLPTPDPKQQKHLFSSEERRVLREIRRLRGFYIHAAVYVAVNIMLIVINLITYHKVLWSFGSLFGWGIGLFFHGLMVYKPFRGFGTSWKRREFEKRMRDRMPD
ncbi:MAG: 2TM domain-containing protein [Gammaproteobacteria bacterium]|nr:2TM domain-containing protein [Gammaproteobacteria bacterium]